ncbi:MAG: DUF4405 domain-containing protein [Sporomusaceae bacterium]|nr:DUF4405 domain-containing protein [Sporomusaceae bacterium]
MISKADINFYLNIALFCLGLISAGTGILLSLKLPELRVLPLKPFHEWSSYILTGLVLIHLFFHSGWIKTMVRNKLTSK